jgi:hypothetical protein
MDETPFQTPPTAEPIPPAPVIPTYIPKPKPPILPIISGFLIVIVIAASVGIAYYKTKLIAGVQASPSPVSTPTTPTMTPEPSATASGSPQSSVKPSTKSSSKPTTKPSSATTSASPTPTPVAQPSLDIRFSNPSAYIKQTIDEGTGDGRVINREYTSIQAGQFDEVPSSWSPRVTVCYHFVSNEEIPGKNLKFSFSLDDKVEVEDNLGQYDKMEAGRIYDWCHDVTTSIGKHAARLTLNPDKSLKEINYTNDLGRVDWENLPDKIAPNFTLTGPTQDGVKTCLSIAYLTDNVTKISNLKIEEKYDSGAWATTTATTYCTTGTSGSEHTYSVKVTDARGNANEQTKTFVLY